MRNLTNIQIVRDHIAALPEERFNMSVWRSINGFEGVFNNLDLLTNPNSCGCIGGWTNAIFHVEDDHWQTAAELLGLSLMEGNELFFPCINTNRITKAHAIAMLDRLLAGRNVDWEVILEKVDAR